MRERKTRRRIYQNWASGLALILMVAFLCSCAGVLGKTVSGYELAGITLKAAYDTAKPSCDQGVLPADKCVQIKAIYNDARASYFLAGEALLLAVDITDLAKRQAKLEEYTTLSTKFTQLTTKLIKLLQDLGVVKGGK